MDPEKPHVDCNFLRGRKITQDIGLSYDMARERCECYNNRRTPRQKRNGTMMEFTAE
jgi:hypothetical protein